jgi:hypothetical protein
MDAIIGDGAKCFPHAVANPPFLSSAFQLLTPPQPPKTFVKQ